MAETLEHIEHLASLAKAKGFLGREFLTWLWYVAETNNDERLTVLDRTGSKELEFDLWVDDRMVLESSTGLTHENVLKGGDPSQSREAAAALSTGKTVKELRLGVNIKDYGEYTAILHCDELTPRSLKLPKPGSPDDTIAPDELPITARIKMTEAFLTVIDGLFARFLSLRTDASWERNGLKAIRDWIKQRQDSLDSGRLH